MLRANRHTQRVGRTRITSNILAFGRSSDHFFPDVGRLASLLFLRAELARSGHPFSLPLWHTDGLVVVDAGLTAVL
jgi:hypothetical protein